MLPQAFTQRMQEMLGEEYPDFLQSYEEDKKQSLRFNPLKGEKSRFLELAPFSLTEVLWEENGYYYEDTDRPGKHPYHEAGVYYIQEASAMLPVTLLDVKPGQRVLDLCAAPGGKSTQLAAAMQGQGILVCNEIHPARAKILSENIERMGVTNALVCSHSPDVLAHHFPGYFDRILVDAPCSGEGMFRKNEEAFLEWSPENVQMCARRQDEVLSYAAEMLAPGGSLVYSTCTFAPAENEGSVSRFLHNHPEFSLVSANKRFGMEGGNPDWADTLEKGLSGKEMEKTIRLWPHKLKGEGHFAALLQKEGEREASYGKSRFGTEKGILKKECREYLSFEKEYLTTQKQGIFLLFGEQLYLAPEELPSLKGLKVLRPGLHLGTVKKNRFEPSHALALSLKPEEAVLCTRLKGEDGLAEKYISGQTFKTEGESGWHLICVDGYSLGFGKAAGGMMKNHYPKGLRKNW